MISMDELMYHMSTEHYVILSLQINVKARDELNWRDFATAFCYNLKKYADTAWLKMHTKNINFIPFIIRQSDN